MTQNLIGPKRLSLGKYDFPLFYSHFALFFLLSFYILFSSSITIHSTPPWYDLGLLPSDFEMFLMFLFVFTEIYFSVFMSLYMSLFSLSVLVLFLVLIFVCYIVLLCVKSALVMLHSFSYFENPYPLCLVFTFTFPSRVFHFQF